MKIKKNESKQKRNKRIKSCVQNIREKTMQKWRIIND